eukprot:TRINITY_DN9276_c0_g1_i4.p1 TRINITY_DN9276_c0_g1~~TRINITY_DN9276_c0_g1_i4.p1  ORF type:complete len:1047 (+),score=150.89 TRINITY_DN9276_c0_g1_i4:62-3202(+)
MVPSGRSAEESLTDLAALRPSTPLSTAGASSTNRVVRYATHKVVGSRLVLNVREFEGPVDRPATPQTPTATSILVTPKNNRDFAAQLDAHLDPQPHELNPDSSLVIHERGRRSFENLLVAVDNPTLRLIAAARMHPLWLTFSDDTLEHEYCFSLAQDNWVTLRRIIYILYLSALYFLIMGFKERILENIVLAASACVVYTIVLVISFTTKPRAWMYSAMWAIVYVSTYIPLTISYLLDNAQVFINFQLLCVFLHHGVVYNRMKWSLPTLTFVSLVYFVLLSQLAPASSIIKISILYFIGCTTVIAIEYSIEGKERNAFLHRKIALEASKFKRTERNKVHQILTSIYPRVAADYLICGDFSSPLYMENRSSVLLFISLEHVRTAYSPEEFSSFAHIFSRCYEEVMTKYEIVALRESNDCFTAITGLVTDRGDSLEKVTAGLINLIDRMEGISWWKYLSMLEKVKFVFVQGHSYGGLLIQKRQSFGVYGEAVDICMRGSGGLPPGIWVDQKTLDRLGKKRHISCQFSCVINSSDWAGWSPASFREAFPYSGEKIPSDMDINLPGAMPISHEEDTEVYSTSMPPLEKSLHESEKGFELMDDDRLLKWNTAIMTYCSAIFINTCLVGIIEITIYESAGHIDWNDVLFVYLIRFGVFLVICFAILVAFYFKVYSHGNIQEYRRILNIVPTFASMAHSLQATIKLFILAGYTNEEFGSPSNTSFVFFEGYASLLIVASSPSLKYKDFHKFALIWMFVWYLLHFLYAKNFLNSVDLSHSLLYSAVRVIPPTILLAYGKKRKDLNIERHIAQKATSLQLTSEAEAQQHDMERVILSFLPTDIYASLRKDHALQKSLSQECCIVVIGISNLTPIVKNIPLDARMTIIQEINNIIETRAAENQMQPIYFTGNSHLLVSNLLDSIDHVSRTMRFCEQVLEYLSKLEIYKGSTAFCVTIGVGHGTCQYGFVGGSRICFDVWGPVVSQAYELAASAPDRKIQISQSLYQRIHNSMGYEFEVHKNTETGTMSYYLSRMQGLWEISAYNMIETQESLPLYS